MGKGKKRSKELTPTKERRMSHNDASFFLYFVEIVSSLTGTPIILWLGVCEKDRLIVVRWVAHVWTVKRKISRGEGWAEEDGKESEENNDRHPVCVCSRTKKGRGHHRKSSNQTCGA
jgi:hypothetical protein